MLSDDAALDWILSEIDQPFANRFGRQLRSLRSQGRIHIFSAEYDDEGINNRAGLVLQTEPLATISAESPARILFMKKAVWAGPKALSLDTRKLDAPSGGNKAWDEVMRLLTERCRALSTTTVIATPRCSFFGSPTAINEILLKKAGFVLKSRIHQFWCSTSAQIPTALLDREFALTQDSQHTTNDTEFIETVFAHDPTARLAGSIGDEPEVGRDHSLFRIHRESRLQALMLLSRHDREIAEIAFLGVAPEARRQGLATQMLQSAVRFASKADLQGLTVATTECNEPAMRLYRKAGFQLAHRFGLYELTIQI
ncbi:MAG: GNAT family N-acetyltransferase [Aureliella sp.]